MGSLRIPRHRAYWRRAPTFSTLVGYLRPSEATLVATCCEEVSNLTPRSPKRAHLVAKIGQTSAQEPPTRPPRPQNTAKTLYCRLFLAFGLFLRNRSQDHEKCSRSFPKWSQDGHLGTNLDHLGSNLPPSWATWVRFWSIRGRPPWAKTASKRNFMPR